jgi:signal transduction histidine kinase
MRPKNAFRNIISNKRLNLTMYFVFFVFFIMVVMFVVAATIAFVLNAIGVISLPFALHGGERGDIQPAPGILAQIALCIFVGTAFSVFFSKKVLSPIRELIDATRKVADGDFDVQVEISSARELEELSRSFNKMVRELSSVETLRGDFIDNFSHELKTPIVSILGFAKLLKDGACSEKERQEYLDVIVSESERLAKLSNSILEISKYESLEIISEKSDYRLDEQIRKAILLMEPAWSKKGLSMNVELDEVYFHGNEDVTHQIWINLIDNAIKFSYEGGTLDIALKDSGTAISFMIQDEGQGMDEQTLAHVFDKFYHAGTPHAKVGNGLGLALVRRIVELCGGEVTATSVQSKGSRFDVTLKKMCMTQGGA